MPTPFFADLVRELCRDGDTGALMPTGAVPAQSLDIHDLAGLREIGAALGGR